VIEARDERNRLLELEGLELELSPEDQERILKKQRAKQADIAIIFKMTQVRL
jgi:hypothetical protein